MARRPSVFIRLVYIATALVLVVLSPLSFSDFFTILHSSKKTSRPNNMDISIRPVTADDLDAVVNIVIKAFPYDEQFAYRYPYREKYPEEHYKYTKMYYAEYLKTTFAGQNTIMVAEAPDLENPEKTKVIALSIWDNPGNREPNPDIPAVAPPKNHPERKDCSPARLKAYSEATMKARKEIFVGRFGERQLSLRQMATLPDYWRRGAASKLLTWGMERARNEDVAVTMFAGRMGNQLYSKFGFKELGRVKVQVPGETEFIYEIAMAWDLHEEVAKSVL
ncbi:acyl-CoA N-acyltransferase [Ilyonectria destructans]|nr:acyl-CoA N-acyltransferase [Ilyonectria destructans]